MSDPLRLRPEDRADSEAVLHRALNTPDIRNAVRADPIGRTSARLRIRALADADEINVAAQDGYQCLALDASAQKDPQGHPTGGAAVPAAAVLTPLVAGSSAAVPLVPTAGARPGSCPPAGRRTGEVVRLAHHRRPDPGTHRRSERAHRLRHADGHRDKGGGRSARPARLEQARMDWQQALLTRGMLPCLRRRVGEDPPLRLAPPARRRLRRHCPAHRSVPIHPRPTGPGQGEDRTRMFGLSELAILLIVVILVIGAKKLPDLARSAGKSARILKAEAKAMKDGPAGADAGTAPRTVQGETITPGTGSPTSPRQPPSPGSERSSRVTGAPEDDSRDDSRSW